MSKSPSAVVKEKFGEKSKLVAAVQAFTSSDLWIDRLNPGTGLAHVSNAKLLRLHAIFSDVQKQFGSRTKLVDAVLELEKRTKDAGFKARVEAWPLPRLLDFYKASKKRAKAAKG